MTPRKRAGSIGRQGPWSFIGFGVGILLLGADQAQRSYVARHFNPYGAVPILGQNWLRLTRVPNSGMAFQSHEMVLRPDNALFVRYLPAVALAVLLVLFALLRRSASRDRAHGRLPALDLGFALLWSGGASNVLSHWRALFVDDTFAVRFFPRIPFCIFNLADVGVVVGLAVVTGFVLLSWRSAPAGQMTRSGGSSSCP